ncbi:hypothetical protein IP84_10650 [beta proteobacterium AAP99]|nr:hypothetical protein IP84_10650 [beta proteobacterium AAP99]
MKSIATAALTALVAGALMAQAMPLQAQSASTYDAELAKKLGADERGMRRYVLVILKTGPNRIPAGPERDEMFKGHFANINRLAGEGKLVQAGPLDGVDGWRGLFVFATASLDEARAWVSTDPVVIKGEMVAELHAFYGSAALMAINEIHGKLTPPRP